MRTLMMTFVVSLAGLASTTWAGQARNAQAPSPMVDVRRVVRTPTEIGVPPSGRRGARPARREECADRESASDEQRRGAGCIGGQDGTFISVRVLSGRIDGVVACSVPVPARPAAMERR